MTGYFYCTAWSANYKKPREILSAASARDAHDSGAQYTVLVGSPEKPSCYINVVDENDFVGVVFLDDGLREYLEYYFIRQPSGKLFLTEGKVRQYRPDRTDERRDAIELFLHYKFSPNGDVRIREIYPDGDARDGSNKMDVSDNYSEYPAFGEYDDLIRRERGFG